MSERRIPTVQELLEAAAGTATAPDVVDQLHALVINLSALVIEQRGQTAALDRIADALEVSSRGGESTAPEQTADGKPLTKLGDRGGSGGAHEGASDTGMCADNSISVSEPAATPTTYLASLRDVARASLAGRTVEVNREYGTPEPGAFVGEHTKLVVIEPAILLHLLDVAKAAREVTRRGVKSDAKGTHSRWVVTHLDESLARLDEVPS